MQQFQLARGDDPLRVLCLGAHSDDIEIGCGGTVLKLLEQHPDAKVGWTVFAAASEIRAGEARAGAKYFLEAAAARETHVHTFRDGFFPDEWAAIKEVFETELKPFEPDVVFTHYRDDRHQDHRVISNLTWNTFRDHLILEYEVPKYDGDLGHPHFFVPLERAACEQKIDGLLNIFTSQAGRSWFSDETFWSHLRLRGIEANAQYAEAFHARKMVW